MSTLCRGVQEKVVREDKEKKWQFWLYPNWGEVPLPPPPSSVYEEDHQLYSTSTTNQIQFYTYIDTTTDVTHQEGDIIDSVTQGLRQRVTKRYATHLKQLFVGEFISYFATFSCCFYKMVNVVQALYFIKPISKY